MKTNELIGPALDWAVAKAKSETYEDYRIEDDGLLHAKFCGAWLSHSYSPSTDWAQGGPIIEREEIGIKRNAPCSAGREWEASPSITAKGAGGRYGYGPTPLIAAMRCYVASKLGDEVNIPEELL